MWYVFAQIKWVFIAAILRIENIKYLLFDVCFCVLVFVCVCVCDVFPP